MIQRIVPGLAVAVLALGAAAVSPVVEADTLLMQRVQQESAELPPRGMRMAQVESRYGVPRAKLSPAGGDSPQHPVINRWEYDNFIVYFEREHVIDAVLKRASASEQGPKKVR